MLRGSFSETIESAGEYLPSKRAGVVVGILAAIITGMLFAPSFLTELHSKSWPVKSGEVLKINHFTDGGWDAGPLTSWPAWSYRFDRDAMRVLYRFTVGEKSVTNSLAFREEESPLGSRPLDLQRLQTVTVYYDPLNPSRSTIVPGLRFRTIWLSTFVFATLFFVLCVVLWVINNFINSGKEADELDKLRAEQSWRDR